jgi:hypothetical protein
LLGMGGKAQTGQNYMQRDMHRPKFFSNINAI